MLIGNADPQSVTRESPEPVHWLANDVLIAGMSLRQELYASVAATARVYGLWRPYEPQWRSVELGAMDQQLRYQKDEHRHVARTRPGELNALHGEIDSYPVHAALIEISTMGANASWVKFLALFAWPHIAPKVLSHEVVAPAMHHIKRLGQFLRDCTAGKVSTEVLERAWLAWASLDDTPPVPRGVDPAAWKAIEAHVHAYRTTRLRRPIDHGSSPQIGIERSWPFETEIDASRMADPDNEALAPEDADALKRATVDSGSEHGEADPLLRVFRNIHEGERAYQHLRLAWGSLSPNEVGMLRSAFHGLGAEAQLAVALPICLAIAPEALPHLAVHATLDKAFQAAADGQWHLAILDSRSVVAVHGVQVAEHAFRRRDGMQGLLPSAHVSVVGLPMFVADLLVQELAGRTGYLLRFYPEIASRAREAAEALRQATGARLTFGRLQEVLATKLLETTQDECLAARALPSSRILVGSGIYYSAYPATRLHREHARALESALGWNVPPPTAELTQALAHAQVGSELVIAPKALHAALAALFERTQQHVRLGRYSPERLVEAHNAIVMYTLAVLYLATGHRATNEPFPRPMDFVAEAVLLCDKRQFGANEQRAFPLAREARIQFERYLSSIDAIAGYLDSDAPNIAAQLRSLLEAKDGHPSCALFSTLSYSDEEYALRPFARKDWKRLWPEWIWPENGTRHFVMQFLNQARMSREFISYGFGHAEPGQTAFNRQSAIAPQDFFNAIGPVIDRLLASLDVKPCDPIKAYRTTDRKTPALHVTTPMFGDSDPGRNRKRPLTRAEKDLVRRLLRDFSGESFRLRTLVTNHCNADPVLTKRLMQLIARCAARRAA